MKTGCIQSNNLKHKVFFSSRPILMSEKGNKWVSFASIIN